MRKSGTERDPLSPISALSVCVRILCHDCLCSVSCGAAAAASIAMARVRGACLMSNSTAPPVLILASISRLRAGLPTRHEGRRRARALRKPPPPLPPSDTQGRLRPTATGRPNSRQTDTERPKPRDHISAEEGWIEGMLHSTICYQPHISV